MPPVPTVTETVICVLPETPVGVPGAPGVTTGATVVADTAVVVVAGAVVVGAIDAAAEQPPARA